MKKVLTVLFVLLIACTMAFALEHRINLGVGFDYATGKAAKKDSTHPDRFLKNSAVELNAGYNIEFENQLTVYDNLGVGYVLDLQRKGTESPWDTDGEWSKEFFDEQKKFLIQEDFGAAYAFHFDNIRVLAGGGVHYDIIIFNASKLKKDNIKTGYFASLGVNILAECEYAFNEHFSAFASLSPNVYLFEFWKFTDTLSCTGFEPGFNGSAVLGVTYKF